MQFCFLKKRKSVRVMLRTQISTCGAPLLQKEKHMFSPGGAASPSKGPCPRQQSTGLSPSHCPETFDRGEELLGIQEGEEEAGEKGRVFPASSISRNPDRDIISSSATRKGEPYLEGGGLQKKLSNIASLGYAKTGL